MFLPTYAGKIEEFKLLDNPLPIIKPTKPFTRTVFAAAHLVSDPLAERAPWQGEPIIDWDNTLKFRHSLWDQGLNLAEAMDTAQRGMGVDWNIAKELIRRTMADAKTHPLKPRVACGAATDQFELDDLTTESSIIGAYSEQMQFIEKEGGQVILMASRAMPRLNAGPDSYKRVYSKVLGQAANPVILHWLGDMFDPALKGYWGSNDLDEAENHVLEIIEHNITKIDGIKISLLEQSREENFRKRLPKNVKLYTGDDFNYPELIKGDGQHFSHALLGIFAAIAPVASQALAALAEGDDVKYNQLMEPTVPLSREIFKAPTLYYKAGIAFLSWLNGNQSHFIMPRGFQSSREITHYAEIFRLADKARLLQNPDLAKNRMKNLLAVYGVY